MKNLPSKSLLNDVFQIVDSRIQYIEYQLNKLSKESYQSNQCKGLPKKENKYCLEIIFKQLELHNRSLKLLILMRRQVSILNAPVIFQLLTDSKYLEFDQSELKTQLGMDEHLLPLDEMLLSASR